MMLTDKDWEILNSKLTTIDPTNYLGTALRDLFGLGCYLHFSGAERAGRKAIRTAMEAAGFHKSNKTIFHKIMDSLASNERLYFNKISAHSELYDVWRESEFNKST